jgi:hypothetical protein
LAAATRRFETILRHAIIGGEDFPELAVVDCRSARVLKLPESLAVAMKDAGMWKDSCPVKLERLSLVIASYVDFSGAEHTDGEIVTLDAAGEFVANFFDKLFAQRFPIAKMRSVHHYNGSDDESMADNNTSCFNHRPIEGTTLASLHSYGLAIDINPLHNPFVQFDELNGTATIHPPAGWQYLNRHNRKAGMVEDVVPAPAAEHGFFVWGGQWTTPIDYHHFQTPRGVAQLLVEMTPEEGRAFFLLCIKLRTAVQAALTHQKTQSLIAAYKANPETFLQVFEEEIQER